MRILAIITGEYGQRHVGNIRAHQPLDWDMEVWRTSSFYPPIIDYPEDHLPETLPSADLILSFAEHKAIPELLHEIVRRTGARSVVAPVDCEE